MVLQGPVLVVKTVDVVTGGPSGYSNVEQNAVAALRLRTLYADALSQTFRASKSWARLRDARLDRSTNVQSCDETIVCRLVD